MEKHKNTKVLKLSRQAQGMLTKVISMIEDNEYCPNVIQQIDSVNGYLHSARKELLEGHLHSCLIDRLKTDKEGSIKELLKIYNIK